MTSSPVHTQFDKNHPLPGETGPTAIVKLYDALGDSLKLNDVIEVFGVISTDPSLSNVNVDEWVAISLFIL